jgi:hypothetical protein
VDAIGFWSMPHRGAHFGASGRRCLELAPARQEVLADPLLGLLPRLVVLPGVQLDVLAGEVGKGARGAFRLALEQGPCLRPRTQIQDLGAMPGRHDNARHNDTGNNRISASK